MPNPNVYVNSIDATSGVNVSSGSTANIALIDGSGVGSWSLEVWSSSPDVDISAVQSSIVINQLAKTAVVTVPAIASAVLIKSVVNNGVDVNGKAQSSYTKSFGLYVLAANGNRLIAANESSESSATHGWIKTLDIALEAMGAGGGGSFTAGGDLSGTSSSQNVIKIQNVGITSTTPTSSQALIFNGTNWAPTTIPTQNPSVGGDLSGTASSATVAKINGSTVPAGGALVTGTVLRATGVSALGYGALDLANTNAVTGVLPSGNLFQATTGTSGAVKLAGDLGGTAALPTVLKINSATVPVAGALVTGTILRATGVSALGYGALDLANANAVTGVLPSANLFQATTGTSGAVKLAKNLGGTAALPTVVDLTITSQANGSMIYFNGTNWVNLPAGITNKVLTANGAGAPTWNSIVQGMTNVRSNAFSIDQVSAGTNAKSEIYHDYFTTTSNTQYTARTITIPASKAALVTVNLWGTDGYTTYGGTKRTLHSVKAGKYYRDSTGGVILSGFSTVQDLTPAWGESPTIDLSLVISTNDILIKVTGQSTYNAKWSMETCVRFLDV